MVAYPFFPNRNVTSLDGLWDFSFIENDGPESYDLATPPTTKTMVPGCFDASPDFYGKRGTALYSRLVTIPSDGHYRLSFGGLGLYAQIFWDGIQIEECRIPYSSFSIDISTQAGSHSLAVLLCNRLDRLDLTPLFRGIDDFYGYGGIYRSVSIERLPSSSFLERVQVTTLDLASRSLRLTFLFSNAPDNSNVSVEFSIDDTPFPPANLSIVNGKASTTIQLPNAAIWSPSSPALHILRAKWKGDEIIERFGIRTIKTCGQKILLNGKKIYLQGYNRHEAHPEFGPVQSPQQMLNDLKWLRDSGANYIRCVHYQQDPRFFDLCDELGFLCWEESIGFGLEKDRFTNELTNLVEIAVRRMVRRNVNNPSIIFWSFLNEGRNNAEEAVPCYEKAVSAIREEDSSRLISYCNWYSMQERCSELCDVVSIHHYPGWIGGEDTDFSPASSHFRKSIQNWLEMVAASPSAKNKPILFSETGTCAIYGFHDRDLAPWSEEFQADYDSESARSILENPRITGFTIWQLFDIKSYTRGPFLRSKARGYNCAGILDEFRRPKLAYDVMRQILRNHPVNDSNLSQ